MKTQKQKILELLQGNGWVHFRKLNDICFGFGQRLHELKHEGHPWEKKREGRVWYYRLLPKVETYTKQEVTEPFDPNADMPLFLQETKAGHGDPPRTKIN